MRKVLLVLVREYLENVRTKAFLIAVLMTPLLVGLSLLLPRWAAGQEVRQRKIAVAEYDSLGDISTLADPGVVQHLIDTHRTMQVA